MDFIKVQLHPNKLGEREEGIASVVIYIPGTYLPHPNIPRGLDLVRDLYCTARPAEASSHVWEREYNMGFPKTLQFSGPEQAGITRCEINYS